MKSSVLLLAASLATNAALLAWWWLRPAPPALRPVRNSPALPAPPPPAVGEAKTDPLLAALATGDAAALKAAGVPAEVIRQLAAARAFGRLAALSRAIDRPPERPAGADFWRLGQPSPRPPPTREQRAERSQAEREFQEAMRAAFGDDFNFDPRARAHSFLPPEKQEMLRRIERDYDEMMREINDHAGGLQLAADREKLKLLRAEKERDIAAVLTPAELEQIELRTSRSAQQVIGRYGDVIASEAEYRRLYALQKTFDDQYGHETYFSSPHSPEEKRLRTEAERRLNDDLRATLGEERWARQSRASDDEYRVLGDLTARLNLPPGTPEQVYAVRDAYAAQSAAIQQHPALNADERHKQLALLATQARTELNARLGPDGAEAYAARSKWLRMLQGGTAFTTDPRALPPGSPRPGGGATVHPLPAPRPTQPSAPTKG